MSGDAERLSGAGGLRRTLGHDVSSSEEVRAERSSPIFLMGPGKSGTTLTHSLLSLHPNLAWFSIWTDRFPGFPALAALNRLAANPSFARFAAQLSAWPRPAEAYTIWNSCFPGFSTAEYDWGRREVTEDGAARLRRLVSAHQVWHGRNRFITKYTGWPRIGFLRAIFPHAKFVYIDRDPRAVVYSYQRRRWWFKGSPEEFNALSWSDKAHFYSQKYLALYKAKKSYFEGTDYHQLFYEDLVGDPSLTMRTLCESLDLSFEQELDRRVKDWLIRTDTNTLWKSELSSKDAELLMALLAEPASDMDYS